MKRHRILIGFAGPLVAALFLPSAGAAIVSFTEATNPVGIFSSAANVETGTVVSTRSAPVVSGANSFTHWTLNGVRKSDASGRSLNPAAFTILEPTAAVANYLPTTQDSDADLLPDYYEIEFFGSLAQTPTSDSDGDGFPVSAERLRNMSPQAADTLVEGGISRRRGAKLLMVAPSQFTLTESSDPVGIINATRSVLDGAVVDLTTVPDPSGALRFTGWFIGGTRIDSPLGSQPTTLAVTANTTVVAHYLDGTVDSDSDGIVDWYEQFQFGNLAPDGSTDTDADGFILNQEILRGQSPLVADSISEGGVSRRRGSLLTVSPVNFVTCTLASDPQGLVSQSLNVVEGAEVATQNLSGVDISGLRFVGWEIGGIRQLDPSGASAGIARFTAADGLVATARFLAPTADDDADGVPDWFEWVYFGGTGNPAIADPDGDGLTLLREFLGGFSPLQADLISEGGISRRRSSGKTGVNLQPFERLRQVQLDGVLAPWFSEDPSVSPPQGVDLGSNPSPALCDWDGDGDLDLFIAIDGSVTVFENIGSRFRMDLSDRTANFGGLASICAGISQPRLAAGDWNLDGVQDLAVSDGLGAIHLITSNHLFTGSGNGAAATILTPVGGGVNPAMGDLDGDGKDDLLIASSDGTIACYLHTGIPSAPYDMIFNSGMTGSVVEDITSLTIGDIDLDGRNDVLAADKDGRIWEFHNQPDGTFLLTSKVWGGSGVGFAPSSAITAGDLEGDGDVDLIGATPDGAIFALRDPKVGRPTGLTADSGADSVLLAWNPDWQSRIKGYHVYRSIDAGLPKARINAEVVEAPRYLDEDLQLAPTHYYQVTALTQAIYAGNTVPTLLESPPSATVSAAVRRVAMDLQDTSGYPNSTVSVLLSVGNSVGLSGQGLDLRVQYPPGLLPVTQFAPGIPSVVASGLGTDLTFTSNDATANGVLIIQGSGGTLDAGQGKLFTLRFRVALGTAVGAVLPLTFSSATVRDLNGVAIPVTPGGAAVNVVARGNGQPPGGGVEVGPFGKGDITGDGWVNDEDLDLLKILLYPSAGNPTPEQLSAGDTNGDGELTHRDLVGILRIITGLEP